MYRKRICSFISFCVALKFVLFPTAVLSQTFGESLIKDMRWRNIGPGNTNGRVSDIEALDNDFATVLVASASGGVWKSINAGTTWEPIFDKYGAASIGDVAFFQKDPDIIWVGTGEKNCRNSVAWGDGIYKSTDGGKTFTNMGLKDTHCVAKVITHPTDPDVVYAAAAGHTWGYSGERGLFKTTDGGKTWKKLTNGLPDDGKTGAIEIVMDPKDPNILYVGFWQRLRQPFRFDSGGPNGGIFKTTDGGKSWRKLTKGLPEGDTGKIGLAIFRSNPKVLMAIVEHGFQPRRNLPNGKPNPDYDDMSKLGSGIYRSEDSGNSWKYMNRHNRRPFYYSHIYINPFDDELIYVLDQDFNVSSDGGKTFTNIGVNAARRRNTPVGLHGDSHALWLDPTNRNRFYIGDDGGAALTHDHGSYIFFDNFVIAQFYAICVDMRDPYYVYGGLQDHATWGGPSRHRDRGILNDHWFRLGGSDDGFHVQVDSTDWRTLYRDSQNGGISRINIETRQSTRIRPRKDNIVNYDDFITDEIIQQQKEKGWRDSPFRFNWSTPIVMSPHNPRAIYLAGNHLFKTVDRGDHWQIISPDLSKNDPIKTRRESGGITPDSTGAEAYGTIITISESSLTPNLIWIGTDDGNVQITRDGGVNWKNVRSNVLGVREDLWVSRVEASHFEEGTAYLTFDGHRSDNFNPWVFKTTDYGQTWTNISNNIPDGQPVYVIKEDLKNPNLLFVGTEFAVFYSINGGKTWTKLNNNMPTVAVHDLVIHPRDNDLIAGTHGRGIWILDDITPLQQATEEVLESGVHLFDNRVATKWLRISRGGDRGHFYFQNSNPPNDAFFSYYLKTAPSTPIKIEISDITGKLMRTYKLQGKPGISRLGWDLRFDPTDQQLEYFVTQTRQRIKQAVQQATSAQRKHLQQLQNKLEKAGTDIQRLSDVQSRMRKIFSQWGFRGRTALQTPEAGPGEYLVKMTVDGKTYKSKIDIREDPLLSRQ